MIIYVCEKIVKNCVFSVLTIYSINMILVKLGFIIPINYFSVIFTTLLGIPGVVVYAILVLKFM